MAELVAARDGAEDARLALLHMTARLTADPRHDATILAVKVAKASHLNALERLASAQRVALAMVCTCRGCRGVSHASSL